MQSFDSAYSLRLYYLIEVFTEVPDAQKERLHDLLGFTHEEVSSKAQIVSLLKKKGKDPAELYSYLSTLYWQYHSLVNPLGGESRDVLNRRRKFHRGSPRGSFYDNVSKRASKFSTNSIYAIFLNAKATLENVRSNHENYWQSIEEAHAPIIGALLGTSYLSIEDWVLEAVEEIPRKDSKLYRYIHDSGFWNEENLLYQAYCSEEYDRIL